MFELQFPGCLTLFVCLLVVYKILDRIVRIPKLKSSVRRSIVITGCDSGFGYAFAKRMDREDFQVIAL